MKIENRERGAKPFFSVIFIKMIWSGCSDIEIGTLPRKFRRFRSLVVLFPVLIESSFGIV